MSRLLKSTAKLNGETYKLIGIASNLGSKSKNKKNQDTLKTNWSRLGYKHFRFVKTSVNTFKFYGKK